MVDEWMVQRQHPRRKQNLYSAFSGQRKRTFALTTGVPLHRPPKHLCNKRERPPCREFFFNRFTEYRLRASTSIRHQNYKTPATPAVPYAAP